MPAERRYVPEGWTPSRKACREAAEIGDSLFSQVGAADGLEEQALFVAMHTCADRARSAREPQRAKWSTRWHAIRSHIVERNMGLVYSMIGRFGSRLIDEDDLHSDAMFALTRAVDRFNPWRGYKFSTYACNVIARALMRRGKQVTRYRRHFPVQHDVSFERPTRSTDSGMELFVERLNQALDGNLGQLTELESEILARRFPADNQSRLTFREIGEGIGLSKERVRQIQNVALCKLRRVLDRDPVLT